MTMMMMPQWKKTLVRAGMAQELMMKLFKGNFKNVVQQLYYIRMVDILCLEFRALLYIDNIVENSSFY